MRANARVDLFVADLAADSRLQLDLGDNSDVYLPRVDWFPDSRGIAVQRQSRDQKTLELLRFDALSGRGRVLLTERSDIGCRCIASSRSCSTRRNSSGRRRATAFSTCISTATTASWCAS